MTPALRPTFDRILCLEHEEATQGGGLIIPNGVKLNNSFGAKMAKVMAVGKDVKEIQKGDIIFYGGLTGSELKFGGITYLILKDVDVIGVVDNG